MKKIDNDGLILCDIQGRVFELSYDMSKTSSEIFIRRFMNCKLAFSMDNEDFLQANTQAFEIIESVEKEYGKSSYGSVKYSKEELYWIGYLYRYYSYTYEITSKQAYRRIKPKKLRGSYLSYHTLDPSKAIERILEEDNIESDSNSDLQKQYLIYKAIRNQTKHHTID